MRAALIDSGSKEIANIIELPNDYDSKSEGAYSPPDGYKIVIDNEHVAEIGGYFKNKQWEKPPIQEAVEVPINQTTLVDLLIAKGVITEDDIKEATTLEPIEESK